MEEMSFRIVFASDVHGHVDKLKRCAALFAKDGNTLIMDGGDTLQGSPFATYIYKLNDMGGMRPRSFGNHNVGAQPIAQVYNQAGFDYVTLGNHDFNYGPAYLRAYFNALEAKCICANVVADLPLRPYTIHTLANGLRVGITGIVTDFVNVWEKEEHLQDIEVTDAFEAARGALSQMKTEADVCICIYHGGFETDLTTGEVLAATKENIGSKICRELDFDILLTGHQHMPVEGCLHHGTYVVQPAALARHCIEINAHLRGGNLACTSRFILPEDAPEVIPPSPDIWAKMQQWLATPIGTLATPLAPAGKVEMALHGCPIAALFNQVQLEATGADISCVGLTNEFPGFDCTVSLGDVINNYPFSNTLTTLQINGAQLVRVLERAASYLELDEAGVPQVSQLFLRPKVEHYNYDFFAGVTYTADLRKSIGSRVSDVQVAGKAVQPQDTFTICLSDYRATGTGGYGAYTECPVLAYGHTDMHQLISDYISRKGDINIKNEEAPNWIYI